MKLTQINEARHVGPTPLSMVEEVKRIGPKYIEKGSEERKRKGNHRYKTEDRGQWEFSYCSEDAQGVWNFDIKDLETITQQLTKVYGKPKVANEEGYKFVDFHYEKLNATVDGSDLYFQVKLQVPGRLWRAEGEKPNIFAIVFKN